MPYIYRVKFKDENDYNITDGEFTTTRSAVESIEATAGLINKSQPIICHVILQLSDGRGNLENGYVHLEIFKNRNAEGEWEVEFWYPSLKHRLDKAVTRGDFSVVKSALLELATLERLTSDYILARDQMLNFMWAIS